MTIIETERLILRPHQECDFEGIHEYATDEDVVEFMQWGPNTLDETRFFLNTCIANQKLAERLSYDFAVISRQDGDFLGTVSLRLSNPHARIAELGYTYQRRVWGKGIASEAARRMVDYGFAELGLVRIFATCNPLNYASAKVLQKCGLILEGCMKSHMLVRGTFRDTLLFATTSTTREANLKSYQSPHRQLSVNLEPGESLPSGTTSTCELYVVLRGALLAAPEEKLIKAGETLFILPACRRPEYKALEPTELLVIKGVL